MKDSEQEDMPETIGSREVPVHNRRARIGQKIEPHRKEEVEDSPDSL